MADSTELYYAEMEAARNSACDAYFEARPMINTPERREMFKNGFERAFKQLWKPASAPETPAALDPRDVPDSANDLLNGEG